MIAIIDYDAGNLMSVKKALDAVGAENVITRNEKEILSADKVILPGVGAFGAAMDQLKSYNLIKTIKEAVALGSPLLGICLGLQLMFEGSEESEGVEGLNLLPGKIVRFPDDTADKIPQIGWNDLSYPNKGKLFAGIDEHSYVYFVHSYYLKAADSGIVVATTDYAGVNVHASVEKDNIFACQFHPEKSSSVGLQILRNFAAL
ncbi:MAG: imidazole glycerol phosphate synthase subunit HisH [Lachnospiraceae bacterium]|nr:imidazole glycerol phosphate synthase subunit HisH [Lachnospiraceae bacterium]